jgi:hypothetical protein
MNCSPVLDGVQQALVPNGGIVTYAVDPGKHTLVVTIDPAADFGSTPASFNLTVTVGKTTKAKATLTAVIPMFPLTIINSSYTAICNVYITPIGSPVGADQLSGQINQGQSMTFSLVKGIYDLYVENCASNPLQNLGSVNMMAAGFTWTVYGPPVNAGGPTTVTMSNASGIDICLIQLVPSGVAVGGTQNWLRPGQILQNGQSQDMLLTKGQWDVYVGSCDGLHHWVTSHVNIQNSSFRFTLVR